MTDPDNKKRRSRLDGLGRLVRVDEPVSGGGLTQQTSYSYNALDNLTQVTQGVQTRTFAYDSLSRLIESTNPESGTATEEGSTEYTYDDNGNLTQKTDPRGVETTYSYDGLNRLTQRSYSYDSPAGGQADPAVSLKTTQVVYSYDKCGTYSRGRLCSVTATNKDASNQDEIARTLYSGYDALGRVGRSVQTTGGKDYRMFYSYDLAGNLVSQTYPSNRVVKTDYDEAGRAAGVWGEKDNVAHYYAGGTGTNAVGYESHGGIRKLRLGNGLWEQRRYNRRLQPTQIGLGTATTTGSLTTTGSGLLLLDYSYGAASNNGNVVSQRIRAGTLNQTQSYTYDELNRLKTAREAGSGTGWSQTYGYDRYGNRRVTGGADHGSNPALTPQMEIDIDTGSNRLAGIKGMNRLGYDWAGNLTADWAGRSLTYDGDNRMVSFDTEGTDSDTTYSYDGEGRRVKKVVGGAITVYVYNAAGQLVAEYTNPWRQETGTRYLTADHLGSTRVVTGEDQSVLSRHDYLPFGEEIGTAYGGRLSVTGYTASRLDGPTQKFTGQERDGESQLDYFGARYFGGAGGRFTSVDPLLNSGRPWEPQSWNRYAYTLNNPLRYVDPDGLYEFGECKNATEKACNEYMDKFQQDLKLLLETYKKSEDEELKAVLDTIGEKDDNNGVVIAFDAKLEYKGRPVDGRVDRIGSKKKQGRKISLNYAARENSLSSLGYKKGVISRARVSLVVHEGTHANMSNEDFKKYNRSRSARVRFEYQAYNAESLFYRAQNALQPSSNPLWDPSWSAVDREVLRVKAVKQKAVIVD